jgi:hypothetical protein
MNYPQKLFHTSLESESKQSRLFESVSVADMEHKSNCITYSALTLEPADPYGW